jgi:hypothetical protein
MNGTVGITDHGWYEFLMAQGGLDEVNLWTPSAHWAFRGDVGSPFFFKLKARHGHAICGFAYFARYTHLPDWLAWESSVSPSWTRTLVRVLSRRSTRCQHWRLHTFNRTRSMVHTTSAMAFCFGPTCTGSLIKATSRSRRSTGSRSVRGSRRTIETADRTYPLHGSPVSIPTAEADAPSVDFLRWHNERVYRAT